MALSMVSAENSWLLLFNIVYTNVMAVLMTFEYVWWDK